MTAGIRSGAVAFVLATAALVTSVRAAPVPSIHVDDDAAPGGEGSARFPYNNLTDALKAAASRVSPVIDVAPGVYPVDRSLIIDRSIECIMLQRAVHGAEVGGGPPWAVVVVF